MTTCPWSVFQSDKEGELRVSAFHVPELHHVSSLHCWSIFSSYGALEGNVESQQRSGSSSEISVRSIRTAFSGCICVLVAVGLENKRTVMEQMQLCCDWLLIHRLVRFRKEQVWVLDLVIEAVLCVAHVEICCGQCYDRGLWSFTRKHTNLFSRWTPSWSAGELPPDQPVDPHKILIIMIWLCC